MFHCSCVKEREPWSNTAFPNVREIRVWCRYTFFLKTQVMREMLGHFTGNFLIAYFLMTEISPVLGQENYLLSYKWSFLKSQFLLTEGLWQYKEGLWQSFFFVLLPHELFYLFVCFFLFCLSYLRQHNSFFGDFQIDLPAWVSWCLHPTPGCQGWQPQTSWWQSTIQYHTTVTDPPSYQKLTSFGRALMNPVAINSCTIKGLKDLFFSKQSTVQYCCHRL